jgi:hypothetical protein
MQNKDRVRGILHFAFSTSYENTWWLMHAAECARTASHYHAKTMACYIRRKMASLIKRDFVQYFSFVHRRIYCSRNQQKWIQLCC